MVRTNIATRLEGVTDNGGSNGVLYGDTFASDAAWHCATLVLDSRTANAGKVYFDGADDTSATNDLSGADGFMTTADMRIHGWANLGTYASSHGIARVAIHDGVALTLAQHRSLCGDLWQPPAGGPSNAKPLAADDTWTQTGGAACWPTSDGSAVCVPGGLTPYTVDATGLGWPTEPSATNRITYNTAINCVNWTCRGTADASTTVAAPDGSYTATEVTLGTESNDVLYAGAGYANDAVLYPRAWLKCSSGVITFKNTAGSALGLWTVDCSAVGGSWALINASHSAMTQTNPWAANASGWGGFKFFFGSSGTASIWAPTLTEEPGTGRSVIPTASASVSTGDIAWAIDNTSGRYHSAASAVTELVTEHAGDCWIVSGTDLLLSGAAGSECSGVWYGLEVRRP